MVERSRRSAGISIRAMSLVGQPGLFIAADPGAALVRRDEQAEIIVGRVGNPGGTPRAIVESRSGSASVEVGSDLFEVGARVVVPAGHLLTVRNSESRRKRFFPIPTKIPTKRTAAVSTAANFHLYFQRGCENCLENSGIELNAQRIVIAVVFSLVPLAGSRLLP